MTQQSQQPSATGPGAQSTSVPSQSVDFASPRPQGIIDLNFIHYIYEGLYKIIMNSLGFILSPVYLLNEHVRLIIFLKISGLCSLNML